MSSPEVPHSTEATSPEQDVRSSNGQTFIQAPEVPHSVVSESPEQDVISSNGQTFIQAPEAPQSVESESPEQDVRSSNGQTFVQAPEVPHSVVSGSPEQDVRSSNGQTFIQAPEVPHSVESEGPEQDVRSSSGQMYSQAVQSQETQPSSVQNSRMASFRTQLVQVTSALPQTTMCPSIQESQTLQQSRHSDPSISTIMQPPSPNMQPSVDQHQHQLWRNQHPCDQQTWQLWNEQTRPGHYMEDQLLQPRTDPFIGGRQPGSYPPYSLQTQGLYDTQMLPQMLPQMYPGGPPSTVHSQGQSSTPYFSSLHLNWSQQTYRTEHRSTGTHPRDPQFLSENITRNVTCRQMTEQLKAHPLGISQSPHIQVYSSVNRNVQPLGSELHLQQSQHHQTFHQWLPQPLLSTAHSGSRTHDIEACSSQTVYQPPPQIAPQSMSQPQPEISNTHQGETSHYFIIHCQHGSCSEQKFLIFYFCFVVLSPINPAVSHPVHKPSRVSKENYTYYFSHKNTFCI